MSKQEKPQFDAVMIQDFFEFLVWELRTRHYENVSQSANINPELLHELERFFQKYATAGLLPVQFVDPSEIPAERHAEAYRADCARSAQAHQQAIDAAETLRPWLEQALTGIEFYRSHHAGRMIRTKLDRDFLDRPGGDLGGPPA